MYAKHEYSNEMRKVKTMSNHNYDNFDTRVLAQPSLASILVFEAFWILELWTRDWYGPYIATHFE